MARFKKEKKIHQSWNPGILGLIGLAWSAVSSAVKVVIGAIVTVLVIVAVCMLTFIGILGNYLQKDVIPDSDFQLDGYALDLTSFMYCLNNNGNIQMMQQIYTTNDRQWADLEEIPEHLIHAAVAIEDRRFYAHQGVDWIATAKASVSMFFGGREFGGSTITQQLVKNRTQEDSITVRRKIQEIFRATSLEKNYDKDVVMEWYLNIIFFGNKCYGVKTAAAEYFGKELKDLTIAECASLISITNNPSHYSPYSGNRTAEDGTVTTGKERNRARQLTCLGWMKSEGWITEEEYEEAKAQEMVFKRGLDPKYTCSSCEFTGYASEFVKKSSKYYCPKCDEKAEINTDEEQGYDYYTWFEEAVLDDVAYDLCIAMGMEWNSNNEKIVLEVIKNGGFHIYTTMDPTVQKYVDAIYQNLDKIPTTASKQQLQSGIIIVDNRSGDIVALAGGVGKKDGFDYYNRATEDAMQTGSAMKPITVYSPAFEAGLITPASVRNDLPLYYIANGTRPYPSNYDDKFAGPQTVLQALARSHNTVASRVLEELGYENSFLFAKEHFQISGLVKEHKFSNGKVMSDIGLSPLALGSLTFGVSVEDMTVAYATFANGGVFREGRLYTKVYDSDGNIVLDNTQESRRILSAKTAEYMNYCLVNVIRNGTAKDAKISGMTVAGKTGSTNGYKDRLFFGYTGYYTAGVWCGYDEPEAIRPTGSNKKNVAIRMWKAVMEPLHKGKKDVPLYDTSNFVTMSICVDCGKEATDACVREYRGNRTTSVLVYPEDAPNEKCTCHIDVSYCTVGQGVATPYCAMFSQFNVATKSLLSITRAFADEMAKAKVTNFTDDCIYLVDSAGNPAHFIGLNNDINLNATEVIPYKQCTIHTKEAWEQLHPPVIPDPTDPSVPVDPSAPTEPEPTVPDDGWSWEDWKQWWEDLF